MTLEATVRALLSRELGEVTPAQRAATAAQAWDELSEHFSRLIGPAGVRAIFDRSVVLTRAKYPCLAMLPMRSPEPPTPTLRACLETQTPDVALDASVALITTFLQLLGRLVGEGLVRRMLRELWPDAIPASATDEEPT